MFLDLLFNCLVVTLVMVCSTPKRRITKIVSRVLRLHEHMINGTEIF